MSASILCLGEILYDVYPDQRRLGGAPFNFAYHLHRLGHDVAFVSRVGRDPDGESIERFLNERGVPDGFLQRDDTHPTGIVRVSLDDRGVPDFTIVAPAAYDFIAYEEVLAERLRGGPDLIYVGTLAQRHAVSRETIQRVLAERPDPTRVFYDVNLRQDFYSRDLLERTLRESDVVKLNADEFELVCGMFGIGGSEPDAAAGLRGHFAIASLCITKGGDGSSLYDGSGAHHWRIGERPDRPIIDTVGAGDAFSALMTDGMLGGAAAEPVLERASEFALRICGISGALPDDPGFYDDFQGGV